MADLVALLRAAADRNDAPWWWDVPDRGGPAPLLEEAAAEVVRIRAKLRLLRDLATTSLVARDDEEWSETIVAVVDAGETPPGDGPRLTDLKRVRLEAGEKLAVLLPDDSSEKAVVQVRDALRQWLGPGRSIVFRGDIRLEVVDDTPSSSEVSDG